jgi:hypothetical protein
MAAGKHLKAFTFFMSREEHKFVKTVAKNKKVSAAKVMRTLVQRLASQPANKDLGAKVRDQQI